MNKLNNPGEAQDTMESNDAADKLQEVEAHLKSFYSSVLGVDQDAIEVTFEVEEEEA